MKMSKSLSAVLAAATMVTMLAVPAFAAGTEVSVSGSSTDVPVVLTADATTFSVTVPTALTIAVAADGTVSTATDAKIINNSGGSVIVSNVTLTAQDPWTLAEYSTMKPEAEKVGSTKLAMSIRECETTASGITFDAAKFPALAASGAADDANILALPYEAKVPAQATVLNNSEIAKVVFTIGWYE